VVKTCACTFSTGRHQIASSTPPVGDTCRVSQDSGKDAAPPRDRVEAMILPHRPTTSKDSLGESSVLRSSKMCTANVPSAAPWVTLAECHKTG